MTKKQAPQLTKKQKREEKKRRNKRADNINLLTTDTLYCIVDHMLDVGVSVPDTIAQRGRSSLSALSDINYMFSVGNAVGHLMRVGEDNAFNATPRDVTEMFYEGIVHSAKTNRRDAQEKTQSVLADSPNLAGRHAKRLAYAFECAVTAFVHPDENVHNQAEILARCDRLLDSKDAQQQSMRVLESLVKVFGHSSISDSLSGDQGRLSQREMLITLHDKVVGDVKALYEGQTPLPA